MHWLCRKHRPWSSSYLRGGCNWCRFSYCSYLEAIVPAGSQQQILTGNSTGALPLCLNFSSRVSFCHSHSVSVAQLIALHGLHTFYAHANFGLFDWLMPYWENDVTQCFDIMYKYTVLARVFKFRDRKILIYFWMGDLLDSLLRPYEGISCKELRSHAVK